MTRVSSRTITASLVLTAVLLAGCKLPSFGSYRGATTQSHSYFNLWVGLAIAGIFVAALVWVLVLWSVIRYRRKSDVLPKQTRYHIPVEILYTITPVIVVAVIFAFTVLVENKINAVTPNPTVKVRVTAFQWGWRFDYEGTNVSITGSPRQPSGLNQPVGITAPPEMDIPVNETTQVVLISNDVVHGFYVPAFTFSRFAQPGVVNVFDFTPTQTGLFRGQCTQYCGLYHSYMLFYIRVLPQDQFRTWLALQEKVRAA